MLIYSCRNKYVPHHHARPPKAPLFTATGSLYLLAHHDFAKYCPKYWTSWTSTEKTHLVTFWGRDQRNCRGSKSRPAIWFAHSDLIRPDELWSLHWQPPFAIYRSNNKTENKLSLHTFALSTINYGPLATECLSDPTAAPPGVPQLWWMRNTLYWMVYQPLQLPSVWGDNNLFGWGGDSDKQTRRSTIPTRDSNTSTLGHGQQPPLIPPLYRSSCWPTTTRFPGQQ